MTFKDLKKRINSSSQQQTQSFDILQNKPFWIWNIEEHKLEDIRTKGECCFNHIIGLPTKEGLEKPIFDYQELLYEALLAPDFCNPLNHDFKDKHLWIKKATGLVKILSTISNNSTPEKKVQLFKDLSDTGLFQSLDKWKKHFDQAVIDATITLMNKWKQEIGDSLKELSLLLAGDIVKPSSIEQIVEKTKKLEKKYLEGKHKEGTSVCEECGNIAEVRAKSPPFEKSQTYHDHLAGGMRYGGKNVISVCKLCRFERTIRGLFTNNGKVIILYPQLALSPYQRSFWDKTIRRFAVDRIGRYDKNYGDDYIPPITYIDRWAKIVFEERLSMVNPKIGEESSVKYQDTTTQIIGKAFEGDLTVALSYLEEDEEYNNFKDLAFAISKGQVHFNNEGLKRLNRALPEKFLYGSPNFVLVILPDISRWDGEPPSATSLRLLFLLCVLARLFFASVSVLKSSNTSINVSTNNGFVQIQRYPSLQNTYSQISIKDNWLPIPELDKITKKLAGLLLTDKELVNNNIPSYGKGQLLKIANSPYVGEVLNRKLQDSGRLSVNLIKYLKTWDGNG